MSASIPFPKHSSSVVNTATDATQLSISHYGYEIVSPKKPFVDSTGFHAYRLHFVVQGGVFLHYKGKIIPLESNTLFILRPDLEIGYGANSSKKTTLCWVAFTGQNAPSILDGLRLNANTPYLKLSPEHARKILQCFSNAFTTKKRFLDGKMLNISLLKELYSIFEYIYLANPTPVVNNTEINAYALQTLEYIHENYADPEISIHTVAKKLGLHPNYLSNVLKNNLSMTFTQILTQRRIEVAISLFSQGETSVSSIAFKVGFNDPLYFSKVFKRINGGYAPKGPRK